MTYVKNLQKLQLQLVTRQIGLLQFLIQVLTSLHLTQP